MEKRYIISERLRKGLLDYLITRPYAEVASGVESLLQLPEVPPPSELETEEDSRPAE